MKRFVDYVAYLEEEVKLKRLQRMADPLCFLIEHQKITIAEAEDKIQAVRQEALKIIPGQMETFDLIYTSRFKRLIEQYLKPIKSSP